MQKALAAEEREAEVELAVEAKQQQEARSTRHIYNNLKSNGKCNEAQF